MRTGHAGKSLSSKNHEPTLYRNGEPEQLWNNLEYSPVIDEARHEQPSAAFVCMGRALESDFAYPWQAKSTSGPELTFHNRSFRESP
jgi:hypothetical protein